MNISPENYKTICNRAKYFSSIYCGRISGMSKDDLYQEGVIAGLEKAGGFSPDNGASFKTYISAYVRGGMTKHAKRMNREIEMPNDEEGHVLEPVDCRYDAPESRLMNAERHNVINAALDRIGADDRKKAIIWAYAEGVQLQDIAKEHKVTPQRVGQLVSDMLAKLKNDMSLALI